MVHKKAWENVYASLTYFGDLYNGNVRKEILIFLIVFEWKVLNSHNFDLPDVNNQLLKCWDTPTKNRPFLLQIAPGHRSVRNNTDLLPPSHSKLFLQVLSMVLVLLATLINLWRGGSQAQDHWHAIYAKIKYGTVSQVLLELVEPILLTLPNLRKSAMKRFPG